MARFTLLYTISTMDSKSKAADWLRANEYDALFLDFPMDIEGFIKDIALGADSDNIIKQLKDLELVGGPEDDHTYSISKPLLDLVSELNGSGVDVYCYLDPLARSFFREVASETTSLTAHAKHGKINLKDWEDLFKEQVVLDIKRSDQEGKYLEKRAKEKNICLDPSEEVKSYLKDQGHEVTEVMMDRSCSPLDVLREKIKDEFTKGIEVSGEELMHLINDHVRFSELINEKTYEEAYKIWKEMHTNVSQQQ